MGEREGYGGGTGGEVDMRLLCAHCGSGDRVRVGCACSVLIVRDRVPGGCCDTLYTMDLVSGG